MAAFTLERPSVFPTGTTVKVYPASNFANPLGDAAPSGSSVAEQTVASSGKAEFTGLTESVPYYAVAEVGGIYRYIGFRIENSSGGSASKSEVEIINKGTDWSAGDNVTVYSENPAGHKGVIKDGTAAAPITAAAPTLKVSQTQGVTGPLAGDGAMGMGAIMGASSGTAASKVQGVGGTFTAKNAGTEGEPDACGVYGVGRILSTGKGRAFGAFLAGRRDTTEARATGAEIYVENVEGGTDTYDINTGAETTKGIWLHSGTAKVAVGVQVGAISEVIPGFDVAFGVNKFAAGTAALQDNSAAERSIQIKGTHAKAALSVASGSGIVVLGNEEKNFEGSQLFEVFYGEESLDPGFVFGTGKGKSVSGILMRNSTGQMKVFASNAANAFLTGTAQGDSGLNFTAGKIFHIGAQTKTSLLRVSETGVGFNGAAPVAKAGAISSPAAELAALKTAVDAIRVALTNVGVTA